MTRACTTPLGSYRPSSSSRVGSCRQGHLMVGPRCSRSRLASHPALRAVPGGRWASVPDREGPCVRCSGGAGAGGRDTGEAAGVCVQSQARRQGCSGCAGGTENELDRRVITREKLVETLAVSAAEITAVTRAEAGTVPAPLPGKTAPPWQEGLPAARHPAPSYPGEEPPPPPRCGPNRRPAPTERARSAGSPQAPRSPADASSARSHRLAQLVDNPGHVQAAQKLGSDRELPDDSQLQTSPRTHGADAGTEAAGDREIIDTPSQTRAAPPLTPPRHPIRPNRRAAECRFPTLSHGSARRAVQDHLRDARN